MLKHIHGIMGEVTKKADIKRFLKRHKVVLILALSIVVLFFVTRLYNILAVPMFNDEAIYIRWAEIFKVNHHQMFVSLTDGKQPSFIWLMTLSLYIFRDPLLAGRLAAMVMGLIGMAGLYLLVRELFGNTKVALAAGLLYVLYPYSLLYDRMALYDSTLAMCMIWSLYAEVLLVRRRTLLMALFSGAALGAGLLTKSGAIFAIYLLPFSLILFDIKRKHLKKELLKWAGLALLAVTCALALYSILRLSPNFKFIASKNGEFTFTISQWLQHPFTYLWRNTRTIWGFITGYSTIPFLLFAIGAFFIDKKYMREKLLLLVWSILPLAALALFGKLLYPRYILFMLMPLLALSAYTAVALYSKVKPRYLAMAVLVLCAMPMLWKDYLILTNFARAPIPELDKYAYIEGFYSGTGVKQVVDILNEKSRHQTIYVGTQGGFGIMPYGIENYTYTNKNVIVQSFAGVGPEVPSQVIEATKKYPTYYVFASPCPVCESIGTPPKTWPVKELLKIKRIEDNSYLTLAQIIPQ